jgi:hypothetical protein
MSHGDSTPELQLKGQALHLSRNLTEDVAKLINEFEILPNQQ